MQTSRSVALLLLLVTVLFSPAVIHADPGAIIASGTVVDSNNSPLEGVIVSYYDSVSHATTNSTTDAAGFYSVSIAAGTYKVGAFPPEGSDLSVYYRPGTVVTEAMTLNISLKPLVEFLNTTVTPKYIPQGGTGNVVFRVVLNGTSDVKTGLQDSDFRVWLHDWTDPEPFWGSQQANAYHLNLTDIVIVSETTPGQYAFSFTLPADYSSPDRWVDLQVAYGDPSGWTGLQVVASTAVELKGQVTALNGTGLANVWVNLWDPVGQRGSGSPTNATGYYSIITEKGVYILNAWPGPDSDVGGFFQQGYNLSSTTTLDITLIPRANFSPIMVTPRSLRVGSEGLASFNLTRGAPPEPGQPPAPGGPALSGIPDSAFEVWLHNWRDTNGQNWWQNPGENQYHQDISDVVTVTESQDNPGSYSFTFSIPESMNVTGGWIDMQVRAGDAMGWSGLQVASSTAKQLSGWVMAINGTKLANVGVNLWNPVNQTGAWSQTDASGQYVLVAEPGVYVVNAWPSFNSDLGGFFRPGLNLTADTVLNITLTPRAMFSPVQVEPRNIRVGGIASVSFNLTRGGGNQEQGQPPSGPALSGITDSAFEVWLHNWRDPDAQNWWQNPSENQYHQDISDSVTVTESPADSGNYHFTFTFPESMNVTGTWMDMQIRMGDAMGWSGFQVASSSSVELNGWVKAHNGTSLANVGVNLWDPVDMRGAWTQTNGTGFYSMLVEPGVYVLNAWPGPSDLGGIFRQGFNMSADRTYNITLTPRASFSQVQVIPRSMRVGATATASFNLTIGGGGFQPQGIEPLGPGGPGGPALSGIQDSAFTVWLHNWRYQQGGQNWWENPVENEFHRDISDEVNITEVAVDSGSYSFTFSLPVSMNVTGGWIDLQIQMGDSQGWTGLQVASSSAKQLSGYVKAWNGTALANVGVGLWNPVNQTGAWSQTDGTGFYILVVEPGTYVLNAWPGPDPTLGGYFKQGFDMTNDRVMNITLTPRASFSQIDANPRNLRLGASSIASFNLTTGGSMPQPGVPPDPNPSGPPLSDIPDSAFTVWLHNWRDQDGPNWWQNPTENQYHQEISDDVTISESAPDSGRYSFTFSVPESMNVTGGWIDLQIQMGDSQGWTGLQVASASAKQLSGYVKMVNGTGLADVGVNLWNPANMTGSWTQTDESGHYVLIAEPGIYMLNAWPRQESGLGGFFRQGYNLTGDTVLNITLTPRANFSPVQVNPRSLRLGSTASASFNLTTGGGGFQPMGEPSGPGPSGPALSGIQDEAFTVWLHNWRDPDAQNWWQNPTENQYHQDISDVEITEDAPESGSYSFTFSVPESMNVTGGWIDMQIQMGDSQGWTGLQVASASAKQLSGYVTAWNGTALANVGVGLWNPVSQHGAWSQTDESGYYVLVAESGVYVLNAWPGPDPSLGGYFKQGFNLTVDTVLNITLTPRANFSPIQVTPRSMRAGSIAVASFNLTTGGGGYQPMGEPSGPGPSGPALSGIQDEAFTVWLHNWRDQDGPNWWQNPNENQYHQEISDEVDITEVSVGSGSYNFTFSIPLSMNVTGGWIDLQIQMGDSQGWTGLQIASENAKMLSGWVKMTNGTGVSNVGVNLWNPVNQTGAWTQTDNSGHYDLVAEPGVYVINVWAGPESGLGGYFKQGFNLTVDTVLNITLTPRANFSPIQINPRMFRVGTAATASFNLTTGDAGGFQPMGEPSGPGPSGPALSGIPDEAFTVWLHNWRDPDGQNWWENPAENQYHQDIGDEVDIQETVPGSGSYSFTFTVPALMNVTGSYIDMQIRLGDSDGWSGFRVASESAKELSGYVKDSDGAPVANVNVGLWDDVTHQGASSPTDANGHYSLVAEAGTYTLNAWPQPGSSLGGFILNNFNLTTDTVYNITLTPNAQFSGIKVNPKSSKVGMPISVSFNVSKPGDGRLTDLADSAFKVRLHNWRDPDGPNWWENPTENQYHKDISGAVNVVETPSGSGSYNFSFTVPSDMNVTGGFIDLQVSVGSSSQFTGLQVASANAFLLKGWVKTGTGAFVNNATVNVFNPVTDTGIVMRTRSGGYYSFYLEPGVYVLDVMAPQGSTLSEFFKLNVTMTSDRTINATLVQKMVISNIVIFPAPFNASSTATAKFNVTYLNGTKVTGLPDSNFQIWIHNWNSSGNWLANPVSDSYHQSISSVTVTETSAGSYSFSFTIPSGMVIDKESLGLTIYIAKNGGWVSTESTGLPIA